MVGGGDELEIMREGDLGELDTDRSGILQPGEYDLIAVGCVLGCVGIGKGDRPAAVVILLRTVDLCIREDDLEVLLIYGSNRRDFIGSRVVIQHLDLVGGDGRQVDLI